MVGRRGFLTGRLLAIILAVIVILFVLFVIINKNLRSLDEGIWRGAQGLFGS